MCLDKISSTKPAPEGIGYKIFRKRGRFLGSEQTAELKKTKTWLAAHQPLGWGSRAGYTCGFHIFVGLFAARRRAIEPVEVVRKVKYRKAHTQGLQEWLTDINVIVAQEIFIYPGEVK